MLIRRKWRGCVASIFAAAFAVLWLGSANAQAPSGEPIRIGLGMALTGPLAANGKMSLTAMKIWEEDVNAKGGLLGRPVKLVYYDDQSSPSTVPNIYTKLIDVDKVDLVISGYASTQIAAAMPVVMQKGRLFISLFGTGINDEFNYPKYFSMIPNGPTPKPAFTRGFFKIAEAQNPKPQPSHSPPRMLNSVATPARVPVRTPRRLASRSSMTATILPPRPTSRLSFGPSRRPIRTCSSSAPIRLTRRGWCGR